MIAELLTIVQNMNAIEIGLIVAGVMLAYWLVSMIIGYKKGY